MLDSANLPRSAPPFPRPAEPSAGATQILRHLLVTPLAVTLQMDSPSEFPPIATVRLRGALGYHLRRRECLTGAPSCTGCTQSAACWYSFAFETPRVSSSPAALDHGDTHHSHPFYLASAPLAAPVLVPGSTLPCLLTIFGSRRTLLPKLLAALEEAGRSGRWGGRFHISSVVSPLKPSVSATLAMALAGPGVLNWPSWEPRPATGDSSVTLRFLSPLRLRVHGQLQRDPDFVTIARALFRRIHLLASLYSSAQLETGWMQALLASAAALIPVAVEWEYVRETRHSGRQHRDIVLDGLFGAIQLAGDVTPLRSFLDVGQWTGIGASTGHGFGCYVLE